jgi:3-hydroxyacyl-CoA dehydrogenase/enoyl-CoA hydratase/3-hydroxybutyryl-CoA epimerase
MGIGFPPWTGGVLQYVNGFPGGVVAFVARADEFTSKYGSRFEPNPLLRKKAENGETF